MQRTERGRLRSILQLCGNNGFHILCNKEIISPEMCSSSFYNYLPLFLCPIIISLDKLNYRRKTINKTTTRVFVHLPFRPAAIKEAPFVCIYRKQIHQSYYKSYIFVTLRNFFFPSGRFLSIKWKSKDLNCVQLSLTSKRFDANVGVMKVLLRNFS